MFNYKYIKGIDLLIKEIPAHLQYWHEFSKLQELNYNIRAIDEYYCDYTNIMTIIFSDVQEQYTIKLTLYNIDGDLNIDMVNGFGSGFAIDETFDSGEEKMYHIYSFESDNSFDLYCEKIKAELL